MMRKEFLLIAVLAAAAACSKADAENKDNTGQNAPGGGGDHKDKTPLDQAENETDRTITQNIRKAVVGDSSLSMNAKNVKIITANGVVTLRGPVESEVEKTNIADKAKQVSGVTRVVNQLEVKN